MSQKNKNWQPHNPERFENYTLLEDKKGFKLPDGKIFKFDKNGGWYIYKINVSYLNKGLMSLEIAIIPMENLLILTLIMMNTMMILDMVKHIHFCISIFIYFFYFNFWGLLKIF